MAGFGLVVDSTCGLPAPLLREHGIATIPVHVSFGDREFRDGVDLTRAGFYELLATESRSPTTSAPSIGECLEVYEAALREHEELLVITLAKELSATYNAAVGAARMAKGSVRVIDSGSVAGGHALVATACVRARSRGSTLAETADLAERLSPAIRFYAYIDTLEYLRRSGRATALQAWFSSLLQIKVLIQIVGGRIEPLDRARTRARGIERLKKLVEESIGAGTTARICTMHANTPAGGAHLEDWARTTFRCAELYNEEIGPALAARAGPGMLAVSFVSDGA